MEQKAQFSRVLQGWAERGFLEGKTPKSSKVRVNPCISISYTRNRISCRLMGVPTGPPSKPISAPSETRLVASKRGFPPLPQTGPTRILPTRRAAPAALRTTLGRER